MTLDPQLAAVIARLRDPTAPGFEAMTPQQARDAVMEMVKLQAQPPELAHTEDIALSAHGLRLRLYRPHELRTPTPVVLFLHGGGWTAGNIEFADQPVRMLSAASQSIWASANYRLAPEHPFPAGLDDAWSALRWLAQRAEELGGDPRRVVIVGESSGANLCAALALRARDHGSPRLAHQYLLFPVLGVDLDTDSYRAYGEGLLLTRAAVRWFWTNYVGPDIAAAPAEAAPLNAPDLRNLAPATIVVAEHDVLRDDGVEYARRLRQAAVPVTLIEWEGMTHGAFQMTGVVDRVRDLMRKLAEQIASTAPLSGSEQVGG